MTILVFNEKEVLRFSSYLKAAQHIGISPDQLIFYMHSGEEVNGYTVDSSDVDGRFKGMIVTSPDGVETVVSGRDEAGIVCGCKVHTITYHLYTGTPTREGWRIRYL